ncbi:SRPBCC family protein [Paucibacter sp. APW11]|uniref:SRPBCC family protein n=1 Tax=Roseateles aquae TaxID=3077235 RepID=A0ABU3PDD1_9BURK|nr:SRPBCC family protein [Paucibacter sp. APW11]MDT9000604.1 SRPBCC family protein [Paucibacter sp. APW11]
MKVLKYLLLTLLGLIALLYLGGMAITPKFHVVRSAQIQAPPERVYALVASPRQWKQWSVWNQRDPKMQIDYSGPESGAGAVWAWKSQTEGDGRMTFTAAEPARRVAYDLFFPDFGTTSSGDLRFEPRDGGTLVTWTMDGDIGSNPLFHWMTLFSDSMVGKDFEAGLKGLKQVAEAH